MSRLQRFTGALLVAAALLGGARYLPPKRIVEVEVPPGASAWQIARHLKERRAIWSAWIFRWWAWLTRSEKRLRAGVYRVDSRAFSPEILWRLRFGRPEGARVTIPEGFLASQIALRLEEAGICSADEFLRIVREKNLEGFLFPETYAWEKNTHPEKVIRDMLAEFDRRFSPEMEEMAKRAGLDRRQAVILASILEKEARLPEERGRISAVFHNRLKRGWRLEADPTVRYALNKWDRPLSARDLQVDSPYNTYRHAGLPPGPICNPGEASLRAAVEPADTKELYFVLSADERSHIFSTNLRDHLRYKQEVASLRSAQK